MISFPSTEQLSTTNLNEVNNRYNVSPFDTNRDKNREFVNIISKKYINEPKTFTVDKSGSNELGNEIEKNGCSIRYSTNQNALGMACNGGSINKGDNWVRGNIFSNKYPYNLHHKTEIIPETKIVRKTPVIKKKSPYWPEPMTYKNIGMYDYKTYPDLRNESRDIDGKPMYRFPHSVSEGFVNNISPMEHVNHDDYSKKMGVLLLGAVGVCWILKKK